jgi:hypothetical protein
VTLFWQLKIFVIETTKSAIEIKQAWDFTLIFRRTDIIQLFFDIFATKAMVFKGVLRREKL